MGTRKAWAQAELELDPFRSASVGLEAVLAPELPWPTLAVLQKWQHVRIVKKSLAEWVS
jgi:hypothetical protein